MDLSITDNSKSTRGKWKSICKFSERETPFEQIMKYSCTCEDMGPETTRNFVKITY